MNEIEAKRIAAVVSIIRPEWRTGHVMSALGDERMRYRTYEDALVAAVACYSDMTTKMPGRIHEPGRWWLTVTATAPPRQARTITDDDCAICYLPRHAPHDGHEWEPQHARAIGERMPDDIKAAIAAVPKPVHEPPAPRPEPSPASDVLAGHTKEAP